MRSRAMASPGIADACFLPSGSDRLASVHWVRNCSDSDSNARSEIRFVPKYWYPTQPKHVRRATSTQMPSGAGGEFRRRVLGGGGGPASSGGVGGVASSSTTEP